MLRSTQLVGFAFAFALVGFLVDGSARGQATIRSCDVLTSDWPAVAAPGVSASALPGAAPAWNGGANPWRLGVGIENLETGVLLTDVERGLPADNAGLQRGDVIISVGGYQVGYVNGALFDLGDELRRRADGQGRVTLLTFDNRNRQLRSLPVTLVPKTTTVGVRGQVLCRERITLSSQAVLTVRLRDVTFASWQNVEVGKQTIPNPPHPPIAFAIDFDPSTIYPDHKYAVDAWLVDRGQVVLQSTTPVPVAPLTNNQPLQVTLVRPTSSVPPTSAYTAPQLEQVNQYYRQYLLRDATPQELAAWQAHLQAGRTVQDVQAYLLASSEYYDRVGNQSARYLSELYRNLFGRQPTAAELAGLQSQYQQYGGARTQFVQDMLRRTPATP